MLFPTTGSFQQQVADTVTCCGQVARAWPSQPFPKERQVSERCLNRTLVADLLEAIAGALDAAEAAEEEDSDTGNDRDGLA